MSAKSSVFVKSYSCCEVSPEFAAGKTFNIILKDLEGRKIRRTIKRKKNYGENFFWAYQAFWGGLIFRAIPCAVVTDNIGSKFNASIN